MLVVCGPSGVGKTTLLDSLLAAEPDLHFAVSWTTRPAREGEVNGRDYHFVSPRQFAAEAAGGPGVLESAEVHGHHYGTPRREVVPYLLDGRVVVVDIDVQGAAQVRASGLPAAFVMVLPPSLDELERRLRSRESETAETLARRLAAAEAEIAHWPEFDFVIVNDDRARAAADLRAVRQAAAHFVRAGLAPRGWREPPRDPEWTDD
ncbi:MAG TPA: guanylate kinase [Armatimonadetes bacterium]|nr:guanylate kinase [Armatimonadota bacterium]